MCRSAVHLFYLERQQPPTQWATASSFTSFLDHTQRRTTVGRTPLDEESARRIDLYQTTHTTLATQSQRPLPDNTHNTSNTVTETSTRQHTQH